MKHILITIAVLACPALARADEAEDHVAKGTRSYNIQDWATALKEYKQAYTLDPKPETLWAIAQTQRLSGDCRSAILTYKAYLRGASAAGANAAEELIKQCQGDLDARQHALDATTPPEPTKPPPPAIVVPPPHPPPPPPQHRSWIRDPLGDTLLVIGVAGLGVGAGFLIEGNLDMTEATSSPTWAGYKSTTEGARSDQKLGVLVGIGGVVVTGLAVWRFIAVKASNNERMVSVTPTSGGALASFTTSF